MKRDFVDLVKDISNFYTYAKFAIKIGKTGNAYIESEIIKAATGTACSIRITKNSVNEILYPNVVGFPNEYSIGINSKSKYVYKTIAYILDKNKHLKNYFRNARTDTLWAEMALPDKYDANRCNICGNWMSNCVCAKLNELGILKQNAPEEEKFARKIAEYKKQFDKHVPGKYEIYEEFGKIAGFKFEENNGYYMLLTFCGKMFIDDTLMLYKKNYSNDLSTSLNYVKVNPSTVFEGFKYMAKEASNDDGKIKQYRKFLMSNNEYRAEEKEMDKKPNKMTPESKVAQYKKIFDKYAKGKYNYSSGVFWFDSWEEYQAKVVVLSSPINNNDHISLNKGGKHIGACAVCTKDFFKPFKELLAKFDLLKYYNFLFFSENISAPEDAGEKGSEKMGSNTNKTSSQIVKDAFVHGSKVAAANTANEKILQIVRAHLGNYYPDFFDSNLGKMLEPFLIPSALLVLTDHIESFPKRENVRSAVELALEAGARDRAEAVLNELMPVFDKIAGLVTEQEKKAE